jgi:hypothetical protein
MPVDLRRYPPDWKEISKAAKERAGHKCEFCGAPNHSLIVRDLKDPFNFRVVKGMEIEAAILDGEKITKVILTTAHLGLKRLYCKKCELIYNPVDQKEFDCPACLSWVSFVPGDKHDKMDCRPENLAAICQRCHLRLDIKEHVENSARTRERKKVESGNILFPGI